LGNGNYQIKIEGVEMKKFQSVVVILALSIARSAGAYAVFDVSYTPQSLTLINSIAPLSGEGAGKAVLDDNGLLTMTLNGELFADAANIGGAGYADILIGSTLQLVTTNSGNGSFNLVDTPSLYPLSASSYSQITSCREGSLDSFSTCVFVSQSAQALLGPDGFYSYSYYSDQSFTLDGGVLNIQATLSGDETASFLASYELTPVSDGPTTSVPEPPLLSILMPGLAGVIFVRRWKNLKCSNRN
jgi:hypothetical protein